MSRIMNSYYEHNEIGSIPISGLPPLFIFSAAIVAEFALLDWLKCRSPKPIRQVRILCNA